ncbi:2,4-diaminobutyrate decarboxylase [Priestia endophytica]|uniref:pyridoxal phosphate-dependent decarboxylase family protein n=1 Tax=Priestia endophytica TaxID=135735 RepID=UPI000DCA51E5|nr:aspartate aminotransferase family protein [Priestia endophytica]RAS82769.1 2,4-diaminobutyrate decarboxylase [Priestia endophytica]
MNTNFEQWFLCPSEQSEKTFHELIESTVSLITNEGTKVDKPFAGTSREDIEAMARKVTHMPVSGQQMEAVMKDIRDVVKHSLWISHPSAMAHLHCPPLLPSIAAEVIIGALNQSMDSWDQSPAATYVEEEVLKYFMKQIGYPAKADGVFTSGGTQSNYMGLLLARNQACQTYFSVNAQRDGLPIEASKLRILCSEHAHFTVQQSAAQLGLGIHSVVKVKTNDQHQLCLDDARKTLEQLQKEGLIPFAIVATAGTTDFGSIDNLKEIADLVDTYQLWLHVDAAYGGALLFSHQYRHLLNHLSEADSITIDFHKLYYQTISCGAFFVKDKQSFQHIMYHADYLNPAEDHEEGIINLVEKSVQTTKRFDALKVLMTFKLLGTDTFGEMIDYTIQLARETAELLRQNNFDVLHEPMLNVVLFRLLPEYVDDPHFVNKLNLELQRYFYQSGEIIIAKTKQNGKVYLKFTMLHPLNSPENMKNHIENIKQIGKKIESEKGGEFYEYSVHY